MDDLIRGASLLTLQFANGWKNKTRCSNEIVVHVLEKYVEYVVLDDYMRKLGDVDHADDKDESDDADD